MRATRIRTSDLAGSPSRRLRCASRAGRGAAGRAAAREPPPALGRPAPAGKRPPAVRRGAAQPVRATRRAVRTGRPLSRASTATRRGSSATRTSATACCFTDARYAFAGPEALALPGDGGQPRLARPAILRRLRAHRQIRRVAGSGTRFPSSTASTRRRRITGTWRRWSWTTRHSAGSRTARPRSRPRSRWPRSSRSRTSRRRPPRLPGDADAAARRQSLVHDQAARRRAALGRSFGFANDVEVALPYNSRTNDFTVGAEWTNTRRC